MTTPAPPGQVRPDIDPLPAPTPLDACVGRMRRAIAYAAPPGYRPLELDLYPPQQAQAPVIVFLHGGGWRLGTRAVFCPTWRDWRPDPFQRLVACGFAVASVDYRLSAEATFPAQRDDVLAALDWLRTRGAELGIDPDRTAVWGESAGAHLAALAGLADFSGVRGVVDWYGPADLRTLADALTAAGVDVELTLVPDADHLWMGAADPQALFDAAVGFARRVTACPTS